MAENPKKRSDPAKERSLGYAEELARWVEAKKAPRQDQQRVAFLAIRDQVQEALAAGYATKTIWQHMRETGRTTASYETFLRYVRRHLAPTRAARKNTPRSQPPAAGFTFNPTPREEDLI